MTDTKKSKSKPATTTFAPLEIQESVDPVDNFLQALQKHDLSRVCISLGTQIDPDGLASQLAMRTILESWGNLDVTCVYRGEWTYASNKVMKKVIGLNGLKPESEIKEQTFTCVIAVDGNSKSAPFPPHFIIDHHAPNKPALVAEDVRPQMGSCSAIMWEYLTRVGIDLSTESGSLLATALAYGIYTDTRKLVEPSRELDLQAFSACLLLKNDKAYNEIVNAPVPKYYHDALVQGWDSKTEAGTALVTGLGVIPETRKAVISHTADHFLGTEGVSTVVVFAIVTAENGKQEINLSIRSHSLDAHDFITKVFGEGRGGGRHGAGAVRIPVPLPSTSPDTETKLYAWVESVIREKVLDYTGDKK